MQELPSDVTMRVDPVLRGRQKDGHHRRVRRTSDSSPAVSVIIPARNAAVTIADALDSVLTQDYDVPVDVTVADGPDGQATTETVRRVVPTAHVVPNPDQHTAAGLNAALRATKAPIVVRVDAHVRLPPGYLRRTTATPARTGAVNVGGRQQPVGSSFFTRAVAVAQTTLLGTGNARYRQSGVEGPTDTVYLGTFRRDAWRPSEDSTTRCGATRITISTGDCGSGAKRSGSTPRWLSYIGHDKTCGNWRDSTSSTAGGNEWCCAATRAPWGCARSADPLLVLGLAASAVLAGAGAKSTAAGVPLAYLGTLAAWSLAVGAWRREPAALILPMVLAAMHLSWGIGFFVPVRPRPSPPPQADPANADEAKWHTQRKTGRLGKGMTPGCRTGP